MKTLLAFAIVLCLSAVSNAQELAGTYVGPWPWLYAPTVIRDPNLHRPTVQYFRPQPQPQVVINNNYSQPAAPATTPSPAEPVQWYYPVVGPTIHIQFSNPAAAVPVAPAPKPVNRYTGR
jgi:hypothetical protein